MRTGVARIAVIAATVLASAGSGAPLNPVHWFCQSIPNKPLHPGARFTVKLRAQIDSGWHLYGMEQDEGGPLPLEISVPDNSALSVGPVRPSKPVQLFDSNFNKRVQLYVDSADFNVRLTVSPATGITEQHQAIQIRYQCCNDTMCLPPRKISVDLPMAIQAGSQRR